MPGKWMARWMKIFSTVSANPLFSVHLGLILTPKMNMEQTCADSREGREIDQSPSLLSEIRLMGMEMDPE